MAPRRPLSLQARSTVAAGLALAAFLGVTGFALDQAYYDATVAAMRDRLQNYVYAYLAGSDVLRGTKLLPPETLPDPEFNRPGSGLYAVVVGDSDSLRWESPSALGRELAFDTRLSPGETRFEGPIDNSVGRVFVLSQGVSWEVDERRPVNLTVHVAQSDQPFLRQITAYRRTLARWLGALAIVLLLLQIALLRWGLSPLRKMVRDVDNVMNGDADRLPGQYPAELAPLTGSLNELIDFGREQLDRYRNTMSDLAHSLKTPLAVLRSEIDGDSGYHSLRSSVSQQSQRMHDIVSYQLSRATASRHQVFSTPLAIESAATSPGYLYAEALAHLGGGDADAAVASLRRAVGARIDRVVYLGVDPLLDPLRSHAEFPALLAELAPAVREGDGKAPGSGGPGRG